MRNGAISFVALLLTACVATSLLTIYKIKNIAFAIVEEQNKKDAHMFSVISLYKETFDTVTYCNKQLKRLAAISAVLSFIPAASALVPVVNSFGKGLKWYQDFLLTRLKIYAPVLDLYLRGKNKLKLLPNYHTVNYKRRMGFSFFGMFGVPPLIEFKKDVFSTACVKHKGLVTDSSVCIDHKDYRNVKEEWFAPTDGVWEVLIKNAY